METPSKDGKSLPMFTPKNSEGSQRVIKQIMVIDPNKLRVAGLDLKMAEALKKSKGNGGNSIASRSKEDKLALARSILNKKLKQAKASKESQYQFPKKEKCDSPNDKPPQKNSQASVVALQSLLSSPRTFITPSQKQPHTMLVNILENDQKTGFIELTISNKPIVQPEKQAVEQIPKASIKMTKPIKSKNEAPKTIESMIISPEVKFEVKRKSLTPTSKRVSSECQSNLPKVIESKVLSPEEKIDMKTLCGTTTKPVPATVRIEITKQEIVQRKTSVQMESMSVNHKPNECVITCAPSENSEKCLPVSPAPKKSEVPLPAKKEESAVDFINSLQINVPTKYETKSKTEGKVDTSGIQEDATSFLMSLFGQKSVKTTLFSELSGKSEINVKPSVDKSAIIDETNQQQNIANTEKDSSKEGQRKNLKPVPIIRHKLRLSGTTKVVTDPTPPAVVSSDSHPTIKSQIQEESSKSNTKVSSIELESVGVDLPAVGTASKVEEENSQKISTCTDHAVIVQFDALAPVSMTCDKKDSRNKDVSIKESLRAETEAASSSLDAKEKNALESKSKSIDKLELVTAKSDASVDNETLKEISSKIVQQVVPDVTHSSTVGVVEISPKCIDKVVPKELQSSYATNLTVKEKNTLSETQPTADQKPTLGAVKCDSLNVLEEDKNSAEAHLLQICKDDVRVVLDNVIPGIPADCAKTELSEQSSVQKESESETEKIVAIEENLMSTEPKVDTCPRTPPPTTRRKGKRSVPILIAKLKRSRKPASSQEKPKEDLKQIASNVDTPSYMQDDGICTQSVTDNITGNRKSPLKADEVTNTMEKTDEKKVQPNKEKKYVEDGKDCSTLNPPSKDKEKIIFEQSTLQEFIPQKPLDNQYEAETSKESRSPMKIEESETTQTAKEISRKDNVKLKYSEPTCSKSSQPNQHEDTNTKEDATHITEEFDYQPATKRISITPTNEAIGQLQKEITTERPKQSQSLETQLFSPKKLDVEKENADTTHDMKTPMKKRASRCISTISVTQKGQNENETVTNVTDEITCDLEDGVSSLENRKVLQTEAIIRPSSRVRKKSSEVKEHLNVSLEAPIAFTDKTNENESSDDLAISTLRSPEVESPKITSKKYEVDLHGDTLSGNEGISHEKGVEFQSSSLDKFNLLCEKPLKIQTKDNLAIDPNLNENLTDVKTVKNEISSLLTANSTEKEDVSDEFEYCDNDVNDSFEDDSRIEPTAKVEKLPLHERPEEEVNKRLDKSNDESDFLGFNDKEIEEGQQSTSLRLSQSEDVSPLKSSSQSETVSKKKTTPQIQKYSLSGVKKQKAEQKHWKKNSARTLKTWLNSSDMILTEKQCDTSEMGKPISQELASNVSTLQEDNNTVKETDTKDSTERSKEVKTFDEAKSKPSSNKNKKGKKGDVLAIKKETKPQNSKKRNAKLEKPIGNLKEYFSDMTHSLTTTNKAAVKGQKKKCKNETLEEKKLEKKSETEELKSLSSTPSKPVTQGKKKKSRKGRLDEKDSEIKEESKSETTSSQKIELDSNNIVLQDYINNLAKTTKDYQKDANCEEMIKGATVANAVAINTPSSAARGQKKKCKKESFNKDVMTGKGKQLLMENISAPATPTSSKLTPKSQKRDKSKQLNKNKDFSQSVKTEFNVKEPAEDLKTLLTATNSRKRKASKCETETPSKVAHISAENDYEFSTPIRKRRGPTKLHKPETPEPAITPKSGKKYKNSTEFNPRLLLIRNKEELKSDEPLVDPSLQMVPKSKDDIQCALCKGYTQKKKWLQHVSEHYGVGWVEGSEPPLDIYSRNSVLYYMVEFFKSSKVKGLNCRLCQALRRSALGLLTHIEQCCLTEQEMKESRIECEHCKRVYAKASMPSHLRSCPELWKKNKAMTELEAEPSENPTEDEMALSNTGRLKRKSVIKAEHKFKDMENIEFNPHELIKHIPQPRKDNWVAAWRRDIASFGKGFCHEKKCPFTAVTVEELQDHCQHNVCQFYTQPGYLCTKCKFRADKIDSTRKHVLERHKPKPIEDFKESDDDAVISSESSTEEESSGERSLVDDDGGEKRDTKKKKQSKKKKIDNTVKQSQPTKDFKKLLPLGRNNIVSEVQRWYQEFINHNYSENPLFSYATPNITQTLDNNIESYFPKSTISPKFVLNGFKTPFVGKLGTTSVQPDQWQQLERLNGMDAASEHVMYLGGPVKAIAWVPFVTQSPSATQYLASVSRKEFNKFTRFVQPKLSRSLVCIHRYNMNMKEERLTGEIYYALAIDEGPIHCIEFLPSGGYDPEANRLGLLAVGTVKSEIRVYSLPLNVQKRDCDMFPILRIEPSFVLCLELEESEDSTDYYKSQCTSLLWSQFAGHNHIIAGYINGFVSIWDITNDDYNLNRFLVNGVRKFVPISYFWSKDDRIKRVAAHYDMNGLRWLAVCNAPRRLVFYDLRDITNPMLIMEERTKNDCNSIDWPAVWENPAFAVGDAMPTHGHCVNFISPSALAFLTRRCDKFCCGVTDLHFNPWNNMYAAGSENGDVQVTPLRETVLDVGFRRKMDEKILTSLDIVAFNGEEISENITQTSHLFETDYKEKYGLVFGPIRQIMGMKTPELYSSKRKPPFILTRLTRVHQLRFNLNQKANTILAVGYANGLMRVLMNKWEDPLKKDPFKKK